MPTALPEGQGGGSVQGEGGIGSPVELPTLRDDAQARRRAVLDRCHEHLVARGFGVLELAPLDLEGSEGIGHQVAGELGVGGERDARSGGEVLWLPGSSSSVDDPWQAPVEGIDLLEDIVTRSHRRARGSSALSTKALLHRLESG